MERRLCEQIPHACLGVASCGTSSMTWLGTAPVLYFPTAYAAAGNTTRSSLGTGDETDALGLPSATR